MISAEPPDPPSVLSVYIRSSRSGLTGQAVRFALTGGLVALVYLGVTTALSRGAGIPFQAALAIGFSCGLVIHFSLQRMFVWLHDERFALSLQHQVGRYLLMAGAQYGCTAASTALLPGLLSLDTEIVYLATMVLVTAAGFITLRLAIFHSGAPAEPSSPPQLIREA